MPIRICVALATVLVLSACSQPPASPIQPQTPTATVTTEPPTPVSRVLDIYGPSTIVVGKGGYYWIEVKENLTTYVPTGTWKSLDPTVLEIRQPFNGVYGRSVGLGSLEVQAMGLTATYRVRVIDKGQFLVSGVVLDAETGGFLGAKIQARDDAGVVIETHSDMYGGGRFAIDVNPGTVQLTVSGAFNDATDRLYPSQSIELAINGNVTQDFALVPVKR